MTAAHPREDISDRAWEILEPVLPGSPGKVGRPALDNRRFLNAVCWILRTGASWRSLPADYGHWNTVHRRFRRWQQDGTWAKVLEAVADDPELGWLVDADDR